MDWHNLPRRNPMEENNNPALAALRRQIHAQEKENPHIAA